MGDVRGGVAEDRPDRPPSPEDVSTLDELVARLRELRVWAGSPSFTRLAKDVATIRAARGVPGGERPGRVTVYECFRAGRRRIDVELLVDIVAVLGVDREGQRAWRRAHRTVSNPVTPTPPSHAPRPPAELPPDIGEFTGRDRESATLAEALGSPGEAHAVVVRVVSGMGGIGKTALAVRVAHNLAATYPDGQLFADLTDAQPDEVLVQFLVGLGVDRSVVPDGPKERVAMYRSRTAGRRVLVVLDNAATEAVVRPLIPGAHSCGVMVTSRSRLTALPGAERVDLGRLSEAEALALLGHTARAGVREWDAEAARTVVGLCDRLPLAIRIAGARLARRRDVRIARFAARLADEKARLDILATGDVGVRACFDLTYADLGAAARDAFLFFGLLSLDTVASWVLAVATERSLSDVELAIDELVDTRLFTTPGTDATGEPRYGMHDLVRLYAEERATADLTDEQRHAGVQRVLESWLALSLEADRSLPYRTLPDPDPGDPRALPAMAPGLLADPLAWFESEKDQLRAIVVHAIRSRGPDLAWRIADACAGFYEARDHYGHWRDTHLACLADPGITGSGAFTMTRNLAYQYSLPVVRGELMTEYAQRALDIGETACLPGGPAQARVLLAVAAIARGSFDEAFGLATTAREHAAPGGTVDLAALSVLGVLARLRGDLDTAVEHFTSLLRHADNHRHNGYELVAMRTLAIIWRAQGRYADATKILTDGIHLTRHLGVRANELLMLIELGEVSALAGAPSADEELAAAVHLAEEMSSDIGAALAWRAMSTADITRGNLNIALDRLNRSLATQRRHGIPHVEAHTLRALGGVHARLGDPEAATRSWHHARDIYVVLGNDTEITAIDRDLATLDESRDD